MSDTTNAVTLPGSVPVHIAHINKTEAQLRAELKNCQSGIETDTLKMSYRDDTGGYHTCVVEDVFDNVNISGDTSVGSRIRASTLSIISDATIGGKVSISGDTSVIGRFMSTTLSTGIDATIGRDFKIGRDASIAGDASIGGLLSSQNMHIYSYSPEVKMTPNPDSSGYELSFGLDRASGAAFVNSPNDLSFLNTGNIIQYGIEHHFGSTPGSRTILRADTLYSYPPKYFMILQEGSAWGSSSLAIDTYSGYVNVPNRLGVGTGPDLGDITTPGGVLHINRDIGYDITHKAIRTAVGSRTAYNYGAAGPWIEDATNPNVLLSSSGILPYEAQLLIIPSYDTSSINQPYIGWHGILEMHIVCKDGINGEVASARNYRVRLWVETDGSLTREQKMMIDSSSGFGADYLDLSVVNLDHINLWVADPILQFSSPSIAIKNDLYTSQQSARISYKFEGKVM